MKSEEENLFASSATDGAALSKQKYQARDELSAQKYHQKSMLMVSQMLVMAHSCSPNRFANVFFLKLQKNRKALKGYFLVIMVRFFFVCIDHFRIFILFLKLSLTT